ncbi:hypothetical protein ACFL96_15330 [Thermoproteota archaeon]
MKIRTLIILIFLIFTAGIANANVDKIWEIPLKTAFDQALAGTQASNFFGEQTIHPSYMPALLQGKLVFGSEQGCIITIDPETLKAEYITRIPVRVRSATVVGRFQVMFYGIHRFSDSPIYATVDFRLKRVRGVIKKDVALQFHKNWLVYSSRDVFFIINPRTGEVFHVQQSDYTAESVIPSDSDIYIFKTPAKSVVEMKLPRWGIGALFHDISEGDKRALLKFEPLGELKTEQNPDFITKQYQLYYHLPNRNIGNIDMKKDKVIWESDILKRELEILYPMTTDSRIIYLLSASKTERSEGYLLCFDKKKGRALWVSRAFAFNENYKPIRFFNSIIAGDQEGNILFLDYKYGEVKNRFPFGGPICTPIYFNESLFIHNGTILYRYDDSSTVENKFKMFFYKLFRLFQNG